MAENIYRCPLCRDTGIIIKVGKDGNEYETDCECSKKLMIAARLKRSGLAKGFIKKSFEEYDTYHNSQLIDAKNTAKRFTELFLTEDSSNRPSLMLCGQAGAGKTHLGTACSVVLIEKGIDVICMGYREEMTSLKSKIMDEVAYNRRITKFKTASMLFIDDFLKGKVTESDVNVIYEIINHRYSNNLPVIISTEKTLDELIDFNEGIGSRLIEMCAGHIIVFSGSELNHRLYKGGAA